MLTLEEVFTPRQISDVADGLSYLHSHNVIHGDLKGPSILVDDMGHARLADFGLAAVAPDFGSPGSVRDGHAVRWAAPEILDRGRPVCKESDIYSFGMVVIEAFTGKAPFYGVAPTTVAVGVLSGKRPTRPTHQSLTNDIWEMIERCWDKDLQHRPDISEVVHCLQTALALQHDHLDVNDNEVPDDATLGSVQQRELSLGSRLRRSRWAPISYILGRLSKLRKFIPAPRHTSDTETARDAGSRGCEKPTDRRRKSSIHESAPLIPSQAEDHTISPERSLVRRKRHPFSLRAYSKRMWLGRL